MNVLLLSPLPPPSGGMARWTQMYLSECGRHGVTAALVNTGMSEKRAKRKDRAFSAWDEMRRAIRILSRMRAELRAQKPELVHICSPCSRFGLLRDYLCVFAAGKRPVVFHCHCNIADQATTGLSRRLLRRIARKSRRVLVLNSASLDFVERIAPGKARQMPNFIESGQIADKRATSETLRSVVYVGHVKLKKGIDALLRVASSMPELRFQVVGPVQELPERTAVPENVELVGEVSHEAALRCMEAADAFFFPSRTEGFANVMLEAMAAGLPIVATDVGANREMIGDRGGVIVPVDDVAAMEAALRSIRGGEVRAAMSAWNLERVRTAYTCDRVLAELRVCYEESV